ncbi:chloramphenicol acetyltransferase [Flavobacterium silvaticum]|uniref:Chloramphenicol acetyltransferase n=1 Tax=Flavobacterium silvaticum TaxID=1852020 RepID=A0A972JGU2_9FLAO|nr:chloramphenicol acetyltransferase [Flavobacterium silvaticum]NMH29399.1 chloramphenicol acetyltransferase [Flavobacterium silvaticum]
MKTKIDKATWNRKDHFDFFSQFEEPFFGLTFTVDCTIAYGKAKAQGVSFFLVYLHKTLQAVNAIENFRYRVIDGEVFLFDVVRASSTIARPDGTFGFSYIDYYEESGLFYEKALKVIDEVKNSTNLLPAGGGDDPIHFSAIPWVDFTSLSHARSFLRKDSCPKISVGKMMEKDGKKSMPVSVHLHHGLADGYHIGLFAEKFQQLLNE